MGLGNSDDVPDAFGDLTAAMKQFNPVYLALIRGANGLLGRMSHDDFIPIGWPDADIDKIMEVCVPMRARVCVNV